MRRDCDFYTMSIHFAVGVRIYERQDRIPVYYYYTLVCNDRIAFDRLPACRVPPSNYIGE